MARIFVYEGKEYPDPDPAMSVDEVRQSLVNFFPELANAEVKVSTRGEDTLHTFSKRVGTKGAESSPVETRAVSTIADSSMQGYAEFRVEDNSPAGDASLLGRTAAAWVEGHADCTLLAVNLNHGLADDSGTVLTLYFEG